jgi:oxazoline/thiazoline synthase
MIRKPAFKPYFHIEIIEKEGIFLLSEHGHFLLTGHLHDMVVPLIDGKRTSDEIADLLREKAKMEEVYYTLVQLEKNGHLIEADDEMPADLAAFWTALGVDTRVARERLASVHVDIQDINTKHGQLMTCALERLGLSPVVEGGFSIVLVDDYLQPELEQLNAVHLANGKPWMLVKPSGFVLWIGPIFVPGKTGCWQCLAQRLRGNREVESFLEHKGQAGPFPLARSRTPASVEQAVNMAALQASIFIAAGVNSHLEGKVITTNVASLLTETHILVRRPQCSSCGEPEKYLNSDQRISFGDAAKTYIQDGGQRSVTPEATFKHFEYHISPITGVVSRLVPTSEFENSPLRVYAAGHNFAFKNDSLYFLRDSLRSKSSGKGVTEAQAKTSALCEAIERYSGVYRAEEKVIHASYRELGDLAIHPNMCMLFSERQYQERLFWLARNSRFQIVPLPFREDVVVDWTPIYSMTQGVSRYLPTGYLYYGYPMKEEEFFYWADSNGNAAGNTYEEAILQGFLELVERDSVCLWWYNRVARPMVDLSSLEDPYIEKLQSYYRTQDREFWVLDLTADTGIPAFAAINRRFDHPSEAIIMGFGAHLDARIGIMRAITEMNQFMPAVLNGLPNGNTDDALYDKDILNWLKTATLANQPYLYPLSPSLTRKISDYQVLCSGNISDDVRTCIAIAASLKMETLVLNQTRADVGLPVVKVIVPGLRHFWARFAPGRLYDVPVKLGWLNYPIAEAYLNPTAMFI